MKMEEEDVGVCLTNAELASRGHPPQLDGAKQNQLDGEKLVAKSQGGRPKGTVEHIELPNGWEVRYKIRKIGLGKGKRSPDRYFVSPEGTFLRSKRELMAHLYLNTLAPQPPEVAGIRLRAWEGSRTLLPACLDVAETAACLGAAEERKVLRGRG